MDGWIKLHRKMLKNPIVCKDSDYMSVWIYLLLNATHRDYPVVFAGEKIILKPGQLITGRKSISEKLNISESKVQRILKSFEIEQQIEQQNSNKNRLISILSWDDYQTDEQQIEHQVNSTFLEKSAVRNRKSAKSEQHIEQQNNEENRLTARVLWDEYQESEQQNEHQVNNKRTTTEQQVNTNKNVKNVKNDKNVKKKDNNTFSAYTSNTELISTLESFVEFRKKIKKPMTDRAIELLLNKLAKLANDDDEKIAILEQSILNGWQGLFPLKNKGGETNAVDRGSVTDPYASIDFGF